MAGQRIEEMDFRPRIPIVRVLLAVVVFGFLAFIFANEKRYEFNLPDRPTASDLVETIGIGLMLVFGFGFITSFLLLPFRLKFTELGIRRFTLFPPWFIPWKSVLVARIGSYKGYLALELSVRRFRWICIPLMDYKAGARLLAEIRRRLPVSVQVSERQLSQLGDT